MENAQSRVKPRETIDATSEMIVSLFLPKTYFSVTTFSQKTAIIAASVLSVLAFFQVVIVLIVFLRQKDTATVTSVVPAPAVSQALVKPGTSSIPQKIERASPILAEPPIAASTLDEASIAPTEVDILVKRATTIRDKGDMTGTLASLRDAQKIFPDDPKIVAEFATTYEQMGLVDKALAQWKRVMDAGEKAGDLYGVAAEKVRVGVTPKEPVSGRDEEGLQPGSTLGLVDVVKNYVNSGSETERVSLRMGIKARENAPIVGSQVNIQAMFYDLIDNKEVEPVDPSTTTVTSEWLTGPEVDWKDEGVEVLKVHYDQKTPVRSENPLKERKYLGYIIRVYYENELHDVTADPVKLLQNFPPPFTLQKEIPQ